MITKKSKSTSSQETQEIEALTSTERNDLLNEQIKILSEANESLKISVKNQVETLLLNEKCANNATQTEKVLCEKFEKNKDEQIVKENLEHDVNNLFDQLKMTKNYLYDALEQNSKLRNDLKMAEKCSEIVPSSSSLCGPANRNELKDHHDHNAKNTESRLKFEFDKSLKDLSIANDTISEQTIKISSLKLRNKILASEIQDLKAKQLQFDEQKQLHINELNSVKTDLLTQKVSHQNHITELNRRVEMLRKECVTFECANSTNFSEVKRLTDVINLKDGEICDLKCTIKSLENDLKSICGDFLFECRNLKKNEFMAILDALQYEKESIFEYNEELQKRLQVEREKFMEKQQKLCHQRIKYKQLEKKYEILCKEKERLDDRKKRTKLLAIYSKQRQDNLSSLNSEPTDLFQQQYELEELRNKLEIANERITILDENLKATLQEKELDSKTFGTIINKSKYILVEKILERNQSASST